MRVAELLGTKRRNFSECPVGTVRTSPYFTLILTGGDTTYLQSLAVPKIKESEMFKTEGIGELIVR